MNRNRAAALRNFRYKLYTELSTEMRVRVAQAAPKLTDSVY